MSTTLTQQDLNGLAERICDLKLHCKQRVLEELLDLKWKVGEAVTVARVQQNDLAFRELGDKTGIDYTDLARSVKFYNMYPDGNYPLKPWRQHIVEFSAKRETESPHIKQIESSDQSVIKQLPSNPPATPEELRHAYDPRREPLPTSESKPALLFREILTWLHIPHISEKELNVTTDRGPRTYIADFFANHTILEVDSELHDPDKDEQRDKDLLALGFETERFLDSDIAITHKTLSRLREFLVVEKVAVH